jgi:ABC-type bacteriocin/lantibiotic exporter with double-glycine peptidase domain
MLCLAGCATFDAADEPAPALSPGSVLLPVPTIEDTKRGECGLACLESLLRYHGLRLDGEARRRFPAAAVDSGSLAPGEIRDYLRGRGLHAHLVHGTLDARPPRGILSLLEKSLPVIVAIDVQGIDHYVLVCGFEPERRWIFVMDPARGVGGVPFDNFEECWRGADHLMLVAGPPR